MPAFVGLWCVAGWIALAAIAIVVARRPHGTAVVYGGSLVVSVAALGLALWQLLAASEPTAIELPVGLPGIGAH